MARVTHIITGLDNAGAEGSLSRLVISDCENTHEIISLTDAGFYRDSLVAAGIRVHTLDMPRGKISVAALPSLWRLIRSTRPDVVQTWMYHADLVGGLLARMAGIRAVVWGIRAGDAPMHVRKSVRIVVGLCALLSRFIPSRIVCNSYTGSRVHQQLRYAAKKIVVIPNGYDVHGMQVTDAVRRSLREQWQIPQTTVAIGMVARWDSLKDHRTLLHALRLIGGSASPPWLCVLVGPGITQENADLAQMISANDLKERVVLFGSRSDVPAVMGALDLHILSSKSEGFPNVVAEAMACGTPCVVSDVGDARHIVGSLGWVVAPGDPAELARVLVTAISATKDHEAWQVRTRLCRSRIQHEFGVGQMVKAYNTVWQVAADA